MAIKKTVVKKPTAKKSASRRTPAVRGRVHAETSHSFDIIPGTHVDERFGPWVLNLIVVPLGGWALRQWAVTTVLQRCVLVVVLLGLGALLVHQVDAEAGARTVFVRRRLAAQILWVATGIAGTIILGFNYWWLLTAAAVGVFLAVWWATAGTSAVRGRGEDQHDQQQDTLADQLGLPNTTRAKPVPAETAGARRTFDVLHPDATVEAIRGAAGLLAAKLGLPPTGARVIEDSGNAGRSKLVLTDRDVLATPTQWPGPSAPGTSIGDSPCRVGVREDGTWETIIRPGQEPDEKRKIEPRPNGHSIAGGMTRSGKTEGELCELAEIVTRTEVGVFWSDTVKPDQTLPDFAPACNRVATDRRQTQLMVQTLLHAIKGRARHLGRLQLRQWAPGCGLTYVIAHFEELAAVAEVLGDNLRKFVAEAGSVGMSLSGSMQRPSSYLLETDTRAQFSINWCYGMRNDTDAAMVLSDSTMDAGAHPESWKNTKPGYNYLEASHVPDHEWSMPCRTFRLPGSALRDHIAVWAERMDDLDDVTKKAMGPGLNDLPTGIGYALDNGWRRTPTGVLVPPGQDPAGYVPRETVRLAPAVPPSLAARWTETGTGDEDGDETRDGTGDEPRDERDEDGDDDESTAALELEVAVKDVAAEVAMEHPIDPEMRPDLEAALAAGEPGTPLDGDYPDGEDFVLAVGVPGPPPTYPQRVEALATILWRLVAGSIGEVLADVPIGEEAGTPIPPTDVTTEDLVAEWYRVPGIQPGQRPALYRLLARLERGGQVEDLGRGGWRIHAGAPNWLRENLASAPDDDTDGDDD